MTNLPNRFMTGIAAGNMACTRAGIREGDV